MPLTLRLPLEVIERILNFALDGDQPLATPSTCTCVLSPAVRTSHLLLISKGITALALPLYWRSVTVLKADDWVRLWGLNDGLFAGERGEERASWVREIKINTHHSAAIPLHPSLLTNYPYEEDTVNGLPEDVFVELEAAFLPLLKHVCFFHHSDGTTQVPDPYERPWDTYESDRYIAGDRQWRVRAARSWEQSQERRMDIWFHDMKAQRQERWNSRGYDDDEEDDKSDDNESNDDDEEAEFDSETDPQDWVHNDEYTFEGEQRDREVALQDCRRLYLTDLLDLDDADIESVRMPIDESALSLMRFTPAREDLPRVTVYCPADEADGKSLRKANLDKNVKYDFVKVPSDIRPSLVADLARRHGAEAVKTWRWVKRDGTTRPLID